MVQDSTLAEPLEPVDIIHPSPGNRFDRRPERSGYVDATVEGTGAEPRVSLIPVAPRDASGHRPGKASLVLGKIPEERGFAGASALVRDALLLELLDQPLDPLARPPDFVLVLLIRARVGPDANEQLPPLTGEARERGFLALRFGGQAIQLPLPRLETCLRVLHFEPARLGQHHLLAILARDAREVVGARDQVAERARREDVFDVAAPAALVDLAQTPRKPAPVGFELHGGPAELGRGFAEVVHYRAAAPLERAQVALRELEIALGILELAHDVSLATLELLRELAALLQLFPERFELALLSRDLRASVIPRAVGGV